MPLLDHFHPPVKRRYPWRSFHSSWATRIADLLNDQWLSPDYVAAEYSQGGSRLEIDVATYEQDADSTSSSPNGSTTSTIPRVWVPPTMPRTMPAVFPESFEVRVFNTSDDLTLVGAIELISPANKDRPAERLAFAAKCASYLSQGVSVVLIDIVTNQRANLHNETMRLMEAADEWLMPAEWELYAASYRPVIRDERPEIDLWTERCTLGQALPTMPLRLTGDLFVPVEFEASYQETCRRRRITP